MKEVNKRRLKYIGHATRNKTSNLMSSAIYGKSESKRKRGRPPTTYQNNIKDITSLNISEIARKARNRDDWRRVVKAYLKSEATIDNDDADR